MPSSISSTQSFSTYTLKSELFNKPVQPIQSGGLSLYQTYEKWGPKFLKGTSFFSRAIKNTFPQYTGLGYLLKSVDYLITIPKAHATVMKGEKDITKYHKPVETTLHHADAFMHDEENVKLYSALEYALNQLYTNPAERQAAKTHLITHYPLLTHYKNDVTSDIKNFISNKQNEKLWNYTARCIGLLKIVKAFLKILNGAKDYFPFYQQTLGLFIQFLSHVIDFKDLERLVGDRILIGFLAAIAAQNAYKNANFFFESYFKKEVAQPQEANTLLQNDPVLKGLWGMAHNNRHAGIHFTFFMFEAIKLSTLVIANFMEYSKNPEVDIANTWVTSLLAYSELAFSAFRYHRDQTQLQHKQKFSQQSPSDKKLHRYLAKYGKGDQAANIIYDRITQSTDANELETLSKVFKIEKKTLEKFKTLYNKSQTHSTTHKAHKEVAIAFIKSRLWAL